MILTFGDFETNGLFRKGETVGSKYIPPFQPSPQSFAYIQTTEDLGNIVDAGVLYFYNPEIIEHRLDAEAIHGLTEQFLSQYKDDFIPNVRKLYKLFYKGNLIGHNMRGYDVKVGRLFLEEMSYGIDIPVNKIEDTMYDTSRYFSEIYSQREGRPVRNKRLKLKVLCEELGIKDSFIKVMHKNIFGNVPTETWHSASWDTTATYLCYRFAKKKGIMK